MVSMSSQKSQLAKKMGYFFLVLKDTIDWGIEEIAKKLGHERAGWGGEREVVGDEGVAEGKRTSPSQKTRTLKDNIVSQISNNHSTNQDNA